MRQQTNPKTVLGLHMCINTLRHCKRQNVNLAYGSGSVRLRVWCKPTTTFPILRTIEKTAWVKIPVLPVMCCVTLGMSLNLSVLQFPIYKVQKTIMPSSSLKCKEFMTGSGIKCPVSGLKIIPSRRVWIRDCEVPYSSSLGNKALLGWRTQDLVTIRAILWCLHQSNGCVLRYAQIQWQTIQGVLRYSKWFGKPFWKIRMCGQNWWMNSNSFPANLKELGAPNCLFLI